MRCLVPVVPPAGQVQQQYHTDPYQVGVKQIIPELHRSEEEWRVGRCNIINAIPCEEKSNHRQYMDEIKVYNVVKERHPSINNGKGGKPVLCLFNKRQQ